MSLHISAISIEGDARDSLERLFAQCEYTFSEPPETVDSWENLHAALIEPEDKAAVYHDSRTTIIDPELVIMLDEDPVKEMSKKFGAVFTMVCEGVSGTYGFSVFRNGEKVRSLTATDGSLVDEFGEPLPEEGGVSVETLSEDTVLGVLAKMGFDYFGLEKANDFKVYHLKFADGNLGGNRETPFRDAQSQGKKPWWKFW